MAGQIRQHEKAVKISAKIKNTPKQLQQKNESKPSEKTLRQWNSDSVLSQ